MAYRPNHANVRSYSYAKKRRNVRFIKALIPLSCIGAVAAVVLGAAASSTATPRSAWSPNARPAIRTLPTPIHVQAATGHASSGWTVQATLPEPAQAGDLLVAYAVWSNTGSVSVSDSRGDGYATAVASKTWGSNDRAGVLFAKNVAGGTTKVTATLSASVTFATLDVHEYANVDAIDPLDGSSAAAGSQGVLDSGPIASVGAGDLVFAAGSATGGVSEGGTGFSVRSMEAGSIVEDRIAKTAGTYNATAAHDSGTWVMQAAAFKARKPHGRMPVVSASPTTSAPPTTSAAPSPTPTITSSSPPPSTTSAPPSTISAPPSSGACALPAYPDASCTGVPPGTTLTSRSGDITISTKGTVLSGLDIHGCVNVITTGVVIRNSRISCTGGYVVYSHTDGSVRIEDSEINCANTRGTAIGDTNVTALRVDIQGCENGFDVDGNFVVEDSYIHDLFQSAEAHTDGLQLTDVAHDITIRHNRIYANDGTSAIISASVGAVNILIDSNLMAGGAYTLYCRQHGAGTNYRVINNHFSTIFYPKVGAYGPWTECADETLSGNVYQQSGQPVPPG